MSTLPPETEALLTAHYQQQGWGTPLEVITYERVPGLFQAEFADGADYVVVQDGKVVAGKGLAALGTYMRAVDLLAHRPEAKDLTTLLAVFGALPPVSGYATPDQFYDYAKHAQLNPKVELAGDAGRLILHYLVPRQGGPVPNPNLVTVKRWTLEIPKTYKLAWHEAETKLDTSGP
ncbi:MAG: hypothetical protein M3680_15585 [Myxococcota bacterium]|nr:hypothetical protein [Myxococcota bacterium]